MALLDATPLIIAEAGVNHNGSRERAIEMVRAAAGAGADLVKFQAFRAEELAGAEAATASYQRANAGARDQRALLGELEFGLDDFEALADACRAEGVGFLCTAFDAAMTGALVELGMPAIKVASGELTNAPALEIFAGFDLPILLSTGMATLDEVGRALGTLARAGAADITLLHCTSLYPAPTETANLRAMATMREAFGRPVGYSDHTLGDHVAIAAVALGAVVIEKHFTLSRELAGPDHGASLEPGEFAAMTERLRETQRALGDGVKRPAPGEAEIARLMRRSWHAARDLSAGAVLGSGDVALKRPATGLAPEASPVGRRLSVARGADSPIRAEDLAEEPEGAHPEENRPEEGWA